MPLQSFSVDMSDITLARRASLEIRRDIGVTFRCAALILLGTLAWGPVVALTSALG